MECLRFGSSIPGGYWGCCAADIMQNFHVDPDAKASIQLVSGDGGETLMKNGQKAFLGMTYREIFLARLRIGTFTTRDMPNHAFFVMLTKSQLSSAFGAKWLAILKENGFEFIRKVNNSVWDVDNYVFALFRNCGPNAVDDQFTAPKEWTDLPNVKPEAWSFVTDPKKVTKEQQTVDTKLFAAIGPAKTFTQTELEAADVPVILSAIRTQFPPQGPEKRRVALEAAAKGLVPSTHHRYNEPDTKSVVKTSSPPMTA